MAQSEQDKFTDTTQHNTKILKPSDMVLGHHKKIDQQKKTSTWKLSRAQQMCE